MNARSAPELLRQLTNITQRNLAAGETFLALDDETLHPRQSRDLHPLRQRPRPDAWNALECLAHLNHYGDYYLPEIRKQITTSQHRSNLDTFTSSWLGNKFAAGMKPGPKTRKISTFKNANPVNFEKTADRSTITEFIRQQKELLELLGLAATVNLTQTKTGISITNLIKIRLGDTLRVIVNHNWRHVEQAERAVGQKIEDRR